MGVITGQGAMKAGDAGTAPPPKAFYIAGPMTGIPQLNFPAFQEAAKVLRKTGIHVINPAELDSDEEIAAALASDGHQYTNGSWGDYLARDVKLVADFCQGIILLDGWQKSKGARLELFVAISCRHIIYEYNDGAPKELNIMDALAILVATMQTELYQEVQEAMVWE